MLRKPNPRSLTVVFLLLSAAVSMLVLGVRNLYDDEISSFFMLDRPVGSILSFAAEGDVHPPGMYLLAHVSYRAVPSYRWMNVFAALALWAGLAVFLLQVVPLFARLRAQMCLLLLATMHPQLLMWSATFRWYSWWTGLALAALVVALQPGRERPVIGTGRAVAVGAMLAALFYLNYITFLFAIALGAAMLLRYRGQKALPARWAAVCVAFLVPTVPQLHTLFTVHMVAGRAQRYSVGVSLLRLLQSVATSEAYLPWHPLAVVAGMVFVGVCWVGAMRVLRGMRGGTRQPQVRRLAALAQDDHVVGGAKVQHGGGALLPIALFGVVFFALVAATGLGGKPRNGLLLIPVLAVAAAWIVDTLRPRTQTVVLLVFAVWSGVGVAHMVGRYGMTKATMNDRPEEVVRLVEETSGEHGCSIVVTQDMNLAFALEQAHLPGLLVVSLFRGYASSDPRVLPDGGCEHPHLYVVETYVAGDTERDRDITRELQSAARFFEATPVRQSFDLDPDARWKRRLRLFSGSERLPDSRYVVASGTMARGNVDAMRQTMPDFLGGHAVHPGDPGP